MADASNVTDAARANSRQLAQRLKEDAAYRQHVEADPYTALREAGIPEEAYVDFMRETGIEPDVAGYQGCNISCFKSWDCFATCLVTEW